MIDIIKLWKEIIETFNDEERCDWCWEFYAPLQESRLNIVKATEQNKCCVKVFVLRNEPQDFGSNLTYNRGFVSSSQNYENYKVLFLISSKEGLNNYNELGSHPVSESRYETILKPLRECIQRDILTDICEDFEVTAWNGRYIYDYQDELYYGIEIRIRHVTNE